MNRRDYDFIENRLLAPETATEACGRLIQNGHKPLADKLTTAAKTYIDVCREIRHELADRDGRGL